MRKLFQAHRMKWIDKNQWLRANWMIFLLEINKKDLLDGLKHSEGTWILCTSSYPSAASEFSLNTMPVPSSDPSVYGTANEFLNQSFPAIALGSSGNLIIVTDNED